MGQVADGSTSFRIMSPLAGVKPELPSDHYRPKADFLNPWKRSRSRLPFHATCRNLLGSEMNSEPKQKRERFQQLTQNPKVKTGKVFAADLRKSKIHPIVKKLTAWRKLNRLSQRKAVAVLARYYFHATFASLRSWEEGRRSPNPHTAAILEKFLLDHPTLERPKK
jgi:DNA-binding transcriptional regulator YiaG